MAKMTWFFYAMVAMAVLTVITFVYSVILVPVWNWTSAIPGAVSKTASGWFAEKPSTTKSETKSVSAAPPPAPVIIYPPPAPEKKPVVANCDKIIKQIENGKYVLLPPECEQTYQFVKQREQDARNERARQDALKQRELDRAKSEREGQARLDAEQQRNFERQQEAERIRAANLEKERMRSEDENRRRQEARADAARLQAKRDADERERIRQREAQKRNETIIQFGRDLKRIIKKN